MLMEQEKPDEEEKPTTNQRKWELALAIGLFFVFSSIFFCIDLTMPLALSLSIANFLVPFLIFIQLNSQDKLLNYMLFLRITPALPGSFVDLASPIVDVPFHIFFLSRLFGRIPAAFIIARAGVALGDLQSVRDLHDFNTLSVLFLIGFLTILPTLLKKANI